MNRESERKRLVGVVDDFCQEEWGTVLHNDILEKFADHLLDDGWMRPPVKVGQTVYRTIKLISGDEFVIEGIIFEVSSTYENGTAKTRFYFWAKGDERTSRHYSLWCDLTEFGKTVFTSREDALAKLKGGEDK